MGTNQPVGHMVSTSTNVKPSPRTCVSNARLNIFFVRATAPALCTLPRATYAAPSRRAMKPLVDRLEGLAPAVAIEQRNPTVSSRSTVGTATEVYDYLRLLWSRIGTPFCRVCGAPVRRDTVESASTDVEHTVKGRLQVTFPLPESARAHHDAIVENLRALGFVRLLADNRLIHLDELEEGTDLAASQELLVIVDRLVVPDDPSRPGDPFRGRLGEISFTP